MVAGANDIVAFGFPDKKGASGAVDGAYSFVDFISRKVRAPRELVDGDSWASVQEFPESDELLFLRAHAIAENQHQHWADPDQKIEHPAQIGCPFRVGTSRRGSG